MITKIKTATLLKRMSTLKLRIERQTDASNEAKSKIITKTKTATLLSNYNVDDLHKQTKNKGRNKEPSIFLSPNWLKRTCVLLRSLTNTENRRHRLAFLSS